MPIKKSKGKKKKVVKEDAKAKKQAIARQKKEAKERKKNNPDKVKIDPTFGLKNKKGSKNRRFVQNAQNNMNAEEIRLKKERQRQKKDRAYQERLRREEAALFQTVDNDPQFKKKKKKVDESEKEEEKIEVDDETLLNNCSPDELDGLIDRLRLKFAAMENLTPVNPETFKAWKDKREQEREAAKQAKAKKKMQKKGGKKGLTGRELFCLTPNIFKDDDDAVANIVYEKDEKKAEDKIDLATVDESLFLDMDGMDDMLDDIEDDTICKKEFVFKKMDKKNITVLDADFNDVVIALNEPLPKEIRATIETGNKQKKDVLISVSTLKDKQTVTSARLK